MKFESKDGVLTVFLEGDIDAQNASSVQAEIEAAKNAHPQRRHFIRRRKITLYFQPGLRVILKFLREAKGKEVVIQNVSRDVYDVLKLTRFVDLMTVKKIA